MSSKQIRPCLVETSRKSLCWRRNIELNVQHSDSQITNQISVMNKAYANAGITWVLAGTTRTTNSGWFNNVGPDSSQQTSMKNSLRTGAAKDLNVYTVGYVFGLRVRHFSNLSRLI